MIIGLRPLARNFPEPPRPHEALKRLQRVKVAMADPEEQGIPWPPGTPNKVFI